MIYLLWAALLVLQNAAFTWVSRARNSGSDWYHATAAVFSNGIWLVAFYFTFDKVLLAAKAGGLWVALPSGLLYVAATVTGSVTMGKLLRRFVERGKRQVGHYDENKMRIGILESAISELQVEVDTLYTVIYDTPMLREIMEQGGLDVPDSVV